MKITLDYDFPYGKKTPDLLRAKSFCEKYNLPSSIRHSSSGNTHFRIDVDSDYLNNLLVRAYLGDDFSRLRADCWRLFFKGGFNRLFDVKFKDGVKLEAGKWRKFTDGSALEFKPVQNVPIKQFEIEWFIHYEYAEESINYQELMRLDHDLA